MKTLLNKLLHKIITLFYPNHCLICNRLTSNKYFCKNCKEPELLSVKLCPNCGSPLKYCSCKFYFYYFDKAVTCFEKANEAETAFYSFKFGQNLLGASYFGEVMADKASKSFGGANIDYVTSVPMHRLKKHSRGYNQSELLARKIAKINNLKYKTLLIQPKATPIQHKASSISERFDNVRDKYKVKNDKVLKNKTVLLVDDIMTTGATISECARQLKLSGCEKVYVITALKTFKKHKK